MPNSLAASGIVGSSAVGSDLCPTSSGWIGAGIELDETIKILFVSMLGLLQIEPGEIVMKSLQLRRTRNGRVL